MFKKLSDFQIQVKLFLAHLEVNYLSGMILPPKDEPERKGRKPRRIAIGLNLNAEKVALQDDENLYFLPQAGNFKRNEPLRAIRTLFIDLDESDTEPPFDKVQPNLFLKRSDGRSYQAFWFLEDDITAEEFKFYQDILADQYNSDRMPSPMRTMRLAGIRRGKKEKDKRHNTPEGLFYEVVSFHHQKMSKKDLEFLTTVENKIPQSQKKTYSPYHDDMFLPIPEDGEKTGRIYPTEEADFYRFFSKNTDERSPTGVAYPDALKRGEGTTNRLYHFACYLQDLEMRHDRKFNLMDFKRYCDAVDIDACLISSSTEDDFKKATKDAKLYAKNVKALREAEEKEQEKRKEVDPAFALKKLFLTHPFLERVKHEIDKYFFVEDEDVFYRENENKILTKVSKGLFTSKFKRYSVTQKKEGGYKPYNPVDLYLNHANRAHFKVVASAMYQPHGPRLIIDGTYYALNTWSYPIFNSKVKGDLTLFFNHIDWLFEEQESIEGLDLREFFLDYLAYIYCNPKPANFCWLLISPKVGVGRTFFTSLLQKLMGKDNVSAVKPDVAYDQYTSWYSTKQFAVVEEIKEDRGFYNKLKPIIGNELISHREMHRNATTVTNYCNLFILSNHLDCLKIDEEDRRILAIHMHLIPKDISYYDELYAWKENDDNIATLARYLRHRNKKVDVKTMRGVAPITQAKQIMQQINKENSVQEVEAYLDVATFGKDGEFVCNRELINRMYANEIGAHRKHRNHIATSMLKLNYVPIIRSKNIQVGKDRNGDYKYERATIFVKASLSQFYNKHQNRVIAAWKEFAKYKLDADDLEAKAGIVWKKPEVYVKKTVEKDDFVDEGPSNLPAIINHGDSFSQKNKVKSSTKKSGPVNHLVKKAIEISKNPDYRPTYDTESLKKIRDEHLLRDNDVSVLKNKSA